jgi:hypothetical protein
MSAGYGVSVWCEKSAITGRLVRGWRVVAQSLVRRLTTEKTTLRGTDEALAFGFDLEGYVGSVGYPVALLALPAIVSAEIAKDERVASADVTASSTTDTEGATEIAIDASVTLEDEGETFELTFNISDAGATATIAGPA